VDTAELLKQGIEAAHAGRRREAREFFLHVVDIDPHNELAWMWLTGYVDELDDKIIACENVLTLNPANEKVRVYLNSLRQQKEIMARDEEADVQSRREKEKESVAFQPQGSISLELAEQLEDEGRIEEAIKTYELLAAQTKDSATFDHIYKQLGRLEGLEKEQIQHIAPAATLLRLSFTWTLVYISFLLVQIGLNPFAHFSLLWFGLPLVALGSFLLALSEVRIKHVIWQKLFQEDGTGSSFARVVLAVIGWVLIVLPFGFMLLSSLVRLRDFQIPPEPF